jgi:hypothetical protein
VIAWRKGSRLEATCLLTMASLHILSEPIIWHNIVWLQGAALSSPLWHGLASCGVS